MHRILILACSAATLMFVTAGCFGGAKPGPEAAIEKFNTAVAHKDEVLAKDYADLGPVTQSGADYVWTALSPSLESALVAEAGLSRGEAQTLIRESLRAKEKLLVDVLSELAAEKPLLASDVRFRPRKTEVHEERAYVRAELEGDSAADFEITLRKAGDGWRIVKLSPEFWGRLWPQSSIQSHAPGPDKVLTAYGVERKQEPDSAPAGADTP